MCARSANKPGGRMRATYAAATEIFADQELASPPAQDVPFKRCGDFLFAFPMARARHAGRRAHILHRAPTSRVPSLRGGWSVFGHGNLDAGDRAELARSAHHTPDDRGWSDGR